ncbi:MAG: bacteriohopanetetrol glucosamine biosynthesis glycosyltransferase HpnI [Acetobacteraceae bacterium]
MILAWLAAVLSVIGLLQAAAGGLLVRRFARRLRPPPAGLPPITLLKPLHGGEPLLEEALASVCRQDYPAFQVVFGVADAADAALPVVQRLQQRFPACDIAVVVDATRHGPNLKVGNLINMLPAARHDVLVISDSDVHAPPDWLRRLVSALEAPGVGLVTTLYVGLPAHALVGRLGAAQINQVFLPGALLSRALGRQDCLGATMMLRRETLARIGGLRALVDHLADDNVLGRLVQGLGLAVALADTVPATTVPEATLAALWRHELRWARTIRALEPVQFAASVLQYPLVWALCAVVASGGAGWSLLWFAAAWAGRAVVACAVDRWLGLVNRTPLWLLPLRELMSVAVMAASYAGRRVEWRGHTMQASRDKPGGVGRGFDPR